MKKKILFILGLVFLMPFSADALSASVNLNCGASKLAPGESTTCSISVPVSSGALVSFTGQVVGSNLEISNYNIASGWQGDKQNGGMFILYGENLFTGNVAIGSFTVKAGNGFSGGSVNITGISLGDENYVERSQSDVSRSIAAKSTDSNLSSLSVSGGTLSPSFNPSTTVYSVTTNSQSITISGTAVGRVDGLGVKNLNYGMNTFYIAVVAEAGNRSVYTIKVNRPDNRSSVNTLSSLTLSPGKINFTPGKNEYSLDVDSNVSSIKVTSNLTDAKSKYTAGSKSMNVSLAYGLNTIKISVQAENGNVRTYVIKVTRKDDRSKDNTLKEIKLSTGVVSVSNDKTAYEIKVPYENENITIDAILNNSRAKTEIKGDKKLKVGENLFEILVTAENGDVKSYRLTVIRQEKNVKLSSNNKLRELTIDGYKLEFNINTYNYKVKIKEDKLNIKAKCSDSKASYEIDGNSNLKDGSVISIIVTAEDGTTKTYKITVEKKSSIGILPYIIFIVLVLISVVLFVLAKKNNDNNKEEQLETI